MVFKADVAIVGVCWLGGAPGTGPSEIAWRRRDKVPNRILTIGVIAEDTRNR